MRLALPAGLSGGGGGRIGPIGPRRRERSRLASAPRLAPRP